MCNVYPDYQTILEMQGVPREKVSDCMAWAFGDDWRTLSIHLSDVRWNERHRDLFVLKGTDEVVEGLKRIGKEYVKLMEKRGGGINVANF